jgi:ribosomal protein S18 acetylase RimI-like enzyme
VTLPFRIERLAAHDRSGFDCGVPALNTYLQRQAGQDVRRRITACYLLIERSTDAIAGYYTLSAGSVLLADLPEPTAKKLPRYPTVPIVRIGRLAVDQRFRGQKLGAALLFDAIKRIAVSEIGAYAVVVDAKDDAAVSFYERHGFTAFASAPRVLYLSISEGVRRMAMQ